MNQDRRPLALIAIPDPGRRQALSRALQEIGLRSTAPGTGPEVLRQARRGGYRVLLLEPEMMGPDVGSLIDQARRHGAFILALGTPPAGADLMLPVDSPVSRVSGAAAALSALALRLAQSEEGAGQLRVAFMEAREQLDRMEVDKLHLEQDKGGLRQRFYRLIEANPDIIYATEYGPTHRNLFVSRRLREVLGHEPDQMIGNADFWLEHLHPGERERVVAEARELLSREGGRLHYRFRHADGSYRRIQDDFRVVRDDSGRPCEVVGCWSDVTDEYLAAQRFRSIFDGVPDGILLVDTAGIIREVNRSLVRMFGYEGPEQLCGRSLSDLITEEYREEHGDLLSRFFHSPLARLMGEGSLIEGLRADGSRLPLEVGLSPFPSGEEDGAELVLAVLRDVTRKRHDEQHISDLIRAYETLSAVNQATVHIQDRQRLLEAVCRIAVEKGGYRLAWVGLVEEGGHRLEPVASAGETGYLEGLRVSAREDEPEGMGPSGCALRTGDAVICEDLEQAAGYGPWCEAARRHGLKASIALPLVVEGETVGTLNLYTHRPDRFTGEELVLLSEVAGDLSFGLEFIAREARRRRAEDHIQSLIFHEPLTGLLNRDGLLQAATDLLEETGEPLGLAVIDLARLREVNVGLGYEFGDRLLQAVATRLREGLDEGEVLGHLGGGVFALLLPRVRSERAALARLQEFLDTLDPPFDLGGAQVAVQHHAGLAIAPGHGRVADVLLRRADLAKESIKEGSGIGSFQPEMEPAPGEHALLARLVQTLGSGCYQLYYQPKMELHSGRIDAVEALVRWQDPEAGLLPPFRFIPLLERSGLMPRLTPQLLAEAARAHARWLQRGLELRVAVNITAADVANPRLPEEVAEACSTAGIATQALVLELTETSVLQEIPVVEENLARLHAMGVELSIDDFGTGHASLSRLVDLPVSQIKIDQHFVTPMIHSPTAQLVVESAIALGQKLGLEVVAEGIEDTATLALLREMGCDRAQGYAISRPLPEEALLRWRYAHA